MLKQLIVVLAAVVSVATAFGQLQGPSLVGYWHNWNDVNAKFIDIDSVDSRYNVITIAFALPTSNADMTMVFTPDRGTAQQLKDRIQRQQAKGKKVLISVGGATAYVDLTTVANRDAFVTSMMSIITTYGFDGVDIDIEHGRSILIEGGTIVNPLNIAQVHLIEAIRTIMAEYRTTYARKMILTFAPETAYVQGGMSGFGNIWGGYLPILDALRDSIDLLHVQLYNSGTMYGIDNKIYAQGTVDFIVSQTEAVIQGFNTRGGGAFAGFPATKVAVGLPATTNAAGGGFVDSATIDTAISYLRKGGTKPGTYALDDAAGYPDLGGMMTWSINWDSVGANARRYPYASVYHALFGRPPLPLPEPVFLVAPLPDESLRTNSTTLRWFLGTPQIDAYHVEVRDGVKVVVSDTTITDTTLAMPTLAPATTYTWRVRARNATGWGGWSTQRAFRSVPFPHAVELRSPVNTTTQNATRIGMVWGKAAPWVTDYRLQLLDNTAKVIVDTVTADTTVSIQLREAASYTWRVQARNVSGWGAWSDTWSFATVPFPDTVQLVAPADAYRHAQDTLTLIWRTGGPWATRYAVEIRYDRSLMYIDTTITDTVTTLTNLGCCSEYTWRVRAKNLAGWGPWSKQRSFTVVPVPDEVVVTSPVHASSVNVDSLVVAWQTAQPLVERYHVQMMQDTALLVNDTTITSTTMPVRGLEADRTYVVRIRARNASGWGPWSRLISVTLTTAEITSVAAASTAGPSLLVYPNPVQDVVTIERTWDRAERIAITDLRGVCVYEAWMPAMERRRSIDVSLFAVGTYTVRIGNVARLITRMR